MSNCGFVILLAIIFTLTFAIHCVVPVAVDLLSPVADSLLVVLILAVLANTCQEENKLPSVHVITNVPPLPAGSVPIVNEVVGIFMPAGTISVMVTLFAVLPQLFP